MKAIVCFTIAVLIDAVANLLCRRIDRRIGTITVIIADLIAFRGTIKLYRVAGAVSILVRVFVISFWWNVVIWQPVAIIVGAVTDLIRKWVGGGIYIVTVISGDHVSVRGAGKKFRFAGAEAVVILIGIVGPRNDRIV